MCDKCNDTGILGIRNGDDDIPCTCNEINELGVTVAVEEPLTEVAKIRLELAAMDNAWGRLNNDPRNHDPYHKAKFHLELNLPAKLHILLDTIDLQQRQIDELLKTVAGVQS